MIPSIGVPIESQFVFYIFLFLDIPSVFCSLILFYYFVRLPEYHREEYSNQMISYLLFGSFLVISIDIPLMFPYLQNDFYIYSLKHPIEFCMFWTIIDFGMYSTNLWLMALASFERYLRIFFKAILMKTRIRRVCLYYIFPTLAFVCPISWYTYAIVFFPCDPTIFDLTAVVCGNPCYTYDASPVLLNVDWALAALVPLFLSVFFILLLICHVLYQKHKINRRLLRRETWKRTRKMFFQLLPIVVIFLIFNMPLIIVGLLSTWNPWFNTTPYFYVNSLSYCLSLCMPLVIFSKQKPIQKQLRIFFRWRRFNRTVPQTITAMPLRPIHTQRMRTINDTPIDR